MNPWNNIPSDYIQPDDFNAVIEIPKGSKQKYEVDGKTGLLKLDRILYTSTHYPANYGFIPRTLADDGDPLDVLVLCSEILVPLCLVRCYPIGMISMRDDNKIDEKIIAVPFSDPQVEHYKDLSDLPRHLYTEMHHFFTVYKELEGIQTDVLDFGDSEEAKQTIRQCLAAFKE